MHHKKKIGLLTFHRALNYGAVLQCWALKRACEALGCEVETIDYNPFGHYEAKWAIGRRPYVAYKYLLQLYRFGKFVDKWLNPTIHTESHKWIKQNPPKDDIYIVGSDQVWANDVVGELLDSYLLDFAPKYARRIAYAASTAGNPLKLTEYQADELRKFAAISMREKQSVPDIQPHVEITVEDVCDPTMLLIERDYFDIERKPLCLPKHYVAYFNLAGDSFCEESAKFIGRTLGLPVVSVVGKYNIWAKRNYPAPTPEQWLYILHHADYICTNSFHGVALSIVFQRPFVYCEAHVKKHSNRVGRIQNLLEQTKLTERYAADIETVRSILKNMESCYDNKAIEKYRTRSYEWLKNAIEDETN